MKSPSGWKNGCLEMKTVSFERSVLSRLIIWEGKVLSKDVGVGRGNESDGVTWKYMIVFSPFSGERASGGRDALRGKCVGGRHRFPLLQSGGSRALSLSTMHHPVSTVVRTGLFSTCLESEGRQGVFSTLVLVQHFRLIHLWEKRNVCRRRPSLFREGGKR